MEKIFFVLSAILCFGIVQAVNRHHECINRMLEHDLTQFQSEVICHHLSQIEIPESTTEMTTQMTTEMTTPMTTPMTTKMTTQMTSEVPTTTASSQKEQLDDLWTSKQSAATFFKNSQGIVSHQSDSLQTFLKKLKSPSDRQTEGPLRQPASRSEQPLKSSASFSPSMSSFTHSSGHSVMDKSSSSVIHQSSSKQVRHQIKFTHSSGHSVMDKPSSSVIHQLSSKQVHHHIKFIKQQVSSSNHLGIYKRSSSTIILSSTKTFVDYISSSSVSSLSH